MIFRVPALRFLALVSLAWVLTAAMCDKQPLRPDDPGNRPDPPPPPPPEGIAALSDLPPFTYHGLPSGLYPGGGNEPPAAHAADGRTALALVQPLDLAGHPDPDGRIVFISVGMSNTTQEFCSESGLPPCTLWSFMSRAAVNPVVDGEHLAIVNGAHPGADVHAWDETSDFSYERVRREWLEKRGLSEAQVQIAWVKQAIADPRLPLPDPGADAYQVEAGLGRMVRAMKAQWPNLRIVFLSSRTYGGYSTIDINPEPFAYETAFAVRGVLAAQITQRQTGAIDPEAGDVGLAGGAPWLAWGPYLWADGENPRDDGLVWRPEDFGGDGVHPSPIGEEKVADLLLDFFMRSPYSQCWFLVGRTCRS